MVFPYQVVFNKTGVNEFHTTCTNRKNSLRISSNIDIQRPIRGFKLHHVTPQKTGTSFKVTWSVEGGSHMEFNPVWDGVKVKGNYSPVRAAMLVLHCPYQWHPLTNTVLTPWKKALKIRPCPTLSIIHEHLT